MTTKSKIIGVVVYTLVCVAGGYYLAPVKVKTEVKTVEVEKKDTNTVQNEKKDSHKTYTKVVIVKPDGTKQTTTTVTDDKIATQKTDTTQTIDIAKSSDQTKEVTKSSSRLNLSALAGVNVSNPANGLLYGVHVSKDILGPISIGLFGLSNGNMGCSVGITF